MRTAPPPPKKTHNKFLVFNTQDECGSITIKNHIKIQNGEENQGLFSKSTTVNENGFKPFANGGYQSLLQLTRMGSHPLLMVDIKVYYS